MVAAGVTTVHTNLDFVVLLIIVIALLHLMAIRDLVTASLGARCAGVGLPTSQVRLIES